MPCYFLVEYDFLPVLIRLDNRIAPTEFRVDMGEPNGRLRRNRCRPGAVPIDEHCEGLRGERILRLITYSCSSLE